jgi:hypothetical protein
MGAVVVVGSADAVVVVGSAAQAPLSTEYPASHVAATELPAAVHVTVAALVTVSHWVQALLSKKNPLLHEAHFAALSASQAAPVAGCPLTQVHVLPESAVQAPLSTEYPALHVAATWSEAVEHVTVAALVTAVQAVHTFELSQVPLAQVAVHVSVAPAAPTVFLEVAVAHAETRESASDVHVYVAPLAAPVTAVHMVQASEFTKYPALHVAATSFEAVVHVTVAALATAPHWVTTLAAASEASLKYPALAVQHLSLSAAVVQGFATQEAPVALASAALFVRQARAPPEAPSISLQV